MKNQQIKKMEKASTKDINSKEGISYEVLLRLEIETPCTVLRSKLDEEDNEVNKIPKK